MFLAVATRWLPALALLMGLAVTCRSALAQHGGHGGGHSSGGHGFGHHYSGHGYGGHGFGGFAHAFGHGVSHHYHPHYYGGYVGVAYSAYGYNSWPYSYTPRVYSYCQTSSVDEALSTGRVAGPNLVATAGITPAGSSYQRAAESAFRSHHYEDAIEWARRAAKEMPRDGRLFLLLSQAHLAVGEYRDAAGAARLGMSLLPTEDWGFVVEHFRDYYHDSDYAGQVRRLRQFIAENPGHADAHFLLGYHWVFLGHSAAANREAYFAAADRELSNASELNPRDEWANRLLGLATGPRPAPSESVAGTQLPGQKPAASESPPSVDASVEYSPPQEFEKPHKPSAVSADGHQQEK